MSCHQDPQLHLSPCRRVVMFLTGALECLLFGGTVFGWPQLVHLLKMDSVYANLCSDVNTAAGDGINQYNVVQYGELFNNSRCVALNSTPIFQTGHNVRNGLAVVFIIWLQHSRHKSAKLCWRSPISWYTRNILKYFLITSLELLTWAIN